jgi:hypothetical protein
MNKRVMCLSCAHVFESGEANEITCPACSYRMDAAAFGQLMWYSAVAMRFGYQYRDTYEKDLAKGPLKTCYSLHELDQTFQFVGIAVLSGIIGNASYSLVRHVVRKLASSAQSESQSQQKLLDQLQVNEIEFRKLTQYLNDFVRGKRYEPEQVANLCRGELLTDPTGLIESVIDVPRANQSTDGSLTLVKDRLKQIAKSLQPPPCEYFSACWSNVELNWENVDEEKAATNQRGRKS